MLPIIFGLLQNSKILLISTIFIVINLTSCLPYPQHQNDRSPLNGVVEVSNTQDCINDANEILSKMDTTVDPCTNFYDFVCGNFTRNAKFLPGNLVLDATSKITYEISKKLQGTFGSKISTHDPDYVIKLKNYYNVCMDEKKILSNGKGELLFNLKREGLIGWPVLERYPLGTGLPKSLSSAGIVDQQHARTSNKNEVIPPVLISPSFPGWRNLPKMAYKSTPKLDTNWKTSSVNWTKFDPEDDWNINFSPSKGQISTYPGVNGKIRNYPGNTVQFSPYLKVPGQFPTIPAAPNQKDIDFDWALNDVLFSKHGFFFSAFLELRVELDPDNLTRRKICLLPPSFAIPSYILSDPGASAIHNRYFDLMMQVAKSLGVSELAHSELYEIYVFQMELAKLSDAAIRKQTGSPIIPVVDLVQYYPFVNWLMYLDQLLTPFIEISPYETITVSGHEYFINITQLMLSKPRRVLANYAYWRAIEKTLPQWNQIFAEILTSLNMGTILDKPSRAEYCTSIVSYSLPLGTGALYVRNHVDKSTKQTTAEIFSDLRNTFRNILQTSNWMDAATKAEALKKLDKMLPLIGYPSEYENSSAVDAYYNDLTISPTSFLVSSLNLNIFTFVFPAGILQPPFFKVSNPKYMNYASLGHVVGHEMTHGFDTIGSQFNADGAAQNWWNPGTRDVFLRRVQCMIDQYNAYVYKDLNLNLNGVMEQTENIADNGGLKMSYIAYKTWSLRNSGKEEKRLPGFEKYSNKQMFWISFASSQCAKYQRDIAYREIKYNGHAPNNFRVIGTISNNFEFGTDFNCPRGTPMNPYKKCAVW